jgi:tetratricopeptide (TPR) repeat protein
MRLPHLGTSVCASLLAAATISVARAQLPASAPAPASPGTSWPASQLAATRPATSPAARDVAGQIRALLSHGAATDAEALAAAALNDGARDAALLLACADCALILGRPALALERVRLGGAALAQQPEFQLRTALAYFAQGKFLGAARVRAVAGGRAGQFADGLLLVESRPGVETFLCCPPESALYPLRQALDGGLDLPEAHVLHARIWLRIGRPALARRILETRASALLQAPTVDTLAAFAEAALAAGDVPDFLRYARRRADAVERGGDEILFDAYVQAAERYAQRGDEALTIEWLRRAAELRPTDDGVLLRLADAEFDAGQPEAARPHYAQVLKLQPNHRERERIQARVK